LKLAKDIFVVILLVAASSFSAAAQQKASIKLIRIEKISPVQIHMDVIDRKVYFRLSNDSDKPLIVYKGKFGPTGYLLKFDENSKEWKYPTSENKPISWKKRTNLDKEILVLPPREYLDYDLSFSSEDDSAKRFKATVFVSTKKTERPVQVFSDEFEIAP
jgi:hypothetical protein